MDFQIASEFSIAGLDGIKAYELNGHAYVSKSQLCLATRGNKATERFSKWMRTAAFSSGANGSQGFPQDKGTAAFVEAHVMSSNGTKQAHLISPLIGYQWFLHEMKSKSAAIRERATELVIKVGAVGFDTMVKEACGVGYAPAESMSEWIKLQPTHEKAAPINAVKQKLLDLGYIDRTKRMGEMINDLFYNRLPAEVFNEVQRVKQEFRHKHNSWCGPSQFQVLTKDAQNALNTIAAAALVLLDTDNYRGITEIVQKLDKIQPRHRKSFVAFVDPNQMNLSY